MFKPGHVEIERVAIGRQPGYRLNLDYAVSRRDNGTYVHFDLDGEVGGRPLHDSFELHRDVAYNFLHVAADCLRRRGIPLPGQAMLFGAHRDYDRLFADLRRQLDVHSGEPIDLERFLRES